MEDHIGLCWQNLQIYDYLKSKKYIHTNLSIELKDTHQLEDEKSVLNCSFRIKKELRWLTKSVLNYYKQNTTCSLTVRELNGSGHTDMD